MTNTTGTEDAQLLVEYFDICNTALETHRHAVRFRALLDLYDRAFANRDVRGEVREAGPKAAASSAVIRRTTGAITTVPESWAHAAQRFAFERSELEDVVSHRDEYIRHPEWLNWTWLTSNAGRS